MRRMLKPIALICAALLICANALAQAYPNKAIKLVVGAADALHLEQEDTCR